MLISSLIFFGRRRLCEINSEPISGLFQGYFRVISGLFLGYFTNSGYRISIHDSCAQAIKSYISSINHDAVIEHEPRKTKLHQASQNTREDLKILFKSNYGLKLAVDVSIINPAQFTSVASTLNCVIEREKNKNTMSISDIRKINSGCSCQFYSNKMVESEKLIIVWII